MWKKLYILVLKFCEFILYSFLFKLIYYYYYYYYYYYIVGLVFDLGLFRKFWSKVS